jgi:hypothetical protein
MKESPECLPHRQICNFCGKKTLAIDAYDDTQNEVIQIRFYCNYCKSLYSESFRIRLKEKHLFKEALVRWCLPLPARIDLDPETVPLVF